MKESCSPKKVLGLLLVNWYGFAPFDTYTLTNLICICLLNNKVWKTNMGVPRVAPKTAEKVSEMEKT